MNVDRAGGRQSGSFIRARAGKYASYRFEKRPQSDGIAKREVGVSQDITSRFPFIRLSRHSIFLFLFSASAHLFEIVRCSRFCLICPSTRITRRPVQSSPRVSLSRRRREYLETLQFSRASPLTYVSAQEKDRPVYPLAVPRKKRGNHFGILSGITNARRGRRGRESTKHSE